VFGGLQSVDCARCDPLCPVYVDTRRPPSVSNAPIAVIPDLRQPSTQASGDALRKLSGEQQG
jgi:hypothetical protein